jgi:hypothetical protein
VPLPNLFVIGAPKCGTTSLDRYLDQHPSIAMSAVKEPKFFISDGTRPEHTGPGDERACSRYVVQREAYEALFSYPETEPSYAGEASPYYLWHPDTPRRIRELVPQARLVAVLREPVARAYSNWADLKEQGREKLGFAEAFAAQDKRWEMGWEPFWLYRSLGLYGEQLARWMAVFAPERMKVVLSEDLAHRPQAVADEIFEFLGVAPLGTPLNTLPMNQTMYKPVDRTGRMMETMFLKAQSARPVTPKFIRRKARSFVRRSLRDRATAGANAASVRGEFAGFFAQDRLVLEGLGVDVSRWDN